MADDIVPNHINKLCNDIMTATNIAVSVLDDGVTWDTHRVIRIIWSGYGICCDLSENKIIVCLPEPKRKKFTHEQWQDAVDLINSRLLKMTSYIEEMS